ncbi:hypothetical protein AAG570_004080 [Ranatra chinensis]|uniref:Odorant receptor n=1 Tax=Ranatra chinensis TaxID=642074 RepID=A0ABD0Y425_9HEMI
MFYQNKKRETKEIECVKGSKPIPNFNAAGWRVLFMKAVGQLRCEELCLSGVGIRDAFLELFVHKVKNMWIGWRQDTWLGPMFGKSGEISSYLRAHTVILSWSGIPVLGGRDNAGNAVRLLRYLPTVLMLGQSVACAIPELTKVKYVSALGSITELYCDYPQSLELKMVSKRQNKKQDTTEIGRALADVGPAWMCFIILVSAGLKFLFAQIFASELRDIISVVTTLPPIVHEEPLLNRFLILTLIYCLGSMTSSLVFLLPAVNTGALLFPSYYPYEIDGPVSFPITIIIQIVTAYFCAVAHIFTDTLLFLFIAFLCRELERIGRILQSVGQQADSLYTQPGVHQKELEAAMKSDEDKIKYCVRVHLTVQRLVE